MLLTCLLEISLLRSFVVASLAFLAGYFSGQRYICVSPRSSVARARARSTRIALKLSWAPRDPSPVSFFLMVQSRGYKGRLPTSLPVGSPSYVGLPSGSPTSFHSRHRHFSSIWAVAALALTVLHLEKKKLLSFYFFFKFFSYRCGNFGPRYSPTVH